MRKVVLLGKGTSLFQNFNEPLQLKLIGTQSFQTGVQVLSLARA